MNESNDIKLYIRLLNIFFFFMLYIHFTACVWFYCCSFNKKWLPGPHAYY